MSRQDAAEHQQKQGTNLFSYNINTMHSTCNFPTPLLPQVHIRNNGENVSMKNTQVSEDNPITENARNKREAKENGICNHCSKGSCRHGRKGIDCKYEYPKPCKKVMQHRNKKDLGCEGRNCSSFHPRMCADSISKGKCFSDAKGTKRKETVEKLCYGDAERNARTGEHSQKNTSAGINPNNILENTKVRNMIFLEMFHNFKRDHGSNGPKNYHDDE